MSSSVSYGEGPAPAAGTEGAAGAVPREDALTGEVREVAFRGGGFQPARRRFVAPIVFAALIGIAEIGTATGWISSLTLPRPSDVAETLIDLARSGALWQHLGPSLQRLVSGGAMGATAGIAVGVVIGLFSIARAGLQPLVAAIFPIPKIALLPLFVIWFGIGEGSKNALIAFGTFTPTVIAAYGGVDNVDRTLIRMGQSFGLSWWSIVSKIVLPGALPAILTGLRVSLAIAIILLVAAEMLGANYGIGAYILEAGSLYDLERLFAGVLVLSVLGLIVSWLIGRAERHFLRWR